MALKKFLVTKIVTTEVSEVFFAEDDIDAIKTAEAFSRWADDTGVVYVNYAVDEVE